MSTSKYRIRKWRGGWCVFAPNRLATPAFYGVSHAHCINALPYLLNIAQRRRRLGEAIESLKED